jgi:hypothetical protein
MDKEPTPEKNEKGDLALHRQSASTEKMYAYLDYIIKDLRPKVLKQLEECRAAGIIRKSTEASLIIEADEKVYNYLLQAGESLSEILMVSNITIKKADKLQITASKSTKKQCKRCKRYTDDVASHPYWPGEKYELCPRCVDVLLEFKWPPFFQISENDYYICADEKEWHEIMMGNKPMPLKGN